MRQHRLGDRVERGLNGARACEEFRAGRRRHHAPADALDQFHAEALLEPAHLQAHRRLADAEPRGRGRETLQRHHVREGAQLVEIEPAHVKEFLMQCIICPIFIYADDVRQSDCIDCFERVGE